MTYEIMPTSSEMVLGRVRRVPPQCKEHDNAANDADQDMGQIPPV